MKDAEANTQGKSPRVTATPTSLCNIQTKKTKTVGSVRSDYDVFGVQHHTRRAGGGDDRRDT